MKSIIEQPFNIKKILYPHQLTSISNMLGMEEDKHITIYDNRRIITNLGILADLTGYGKTLSVLGLISKSKGWDDKGGIYIKKKIIGNNYVYQEDEEYYEKVDCSVVIVNSILLGQWENELRDNFLRWKTIYTKRDIETINLDELDLILCDYKYYNLLGCRFSKIAWKRIIIDEPNTIKMIDEKYICNFIWFITATPYELLYKKKYEELLLNMNEDMFAKIIVKNDDDYVKQSFQMPTNTIVRYDCLNMLYEILKSTVRPNMEYLICAENINGIFDLLGMCRDRRDVSIIDIVLKRKISKLREIDGLLEIKNNSEKLLQRRQNIENEIINLNINFQTVLNKYPCLICFDKIDNPSIISCCQNIFCNQCITKHIDISNKCVICKSSVSLESIICVNINYKKSELSVNRSVRTKCQTILDIIKNTVLGKFIIYSEYSETFETLKRILSDNEIIYTEMKGLKTQKQRNLDSYKNGNINILLLTTLQYSAGIDLMNTTDIILYHNMPDAVKIQILGRANRIGRSIPLRIHHLF